MRITVCLLVVVLCCGGISAQIAVNPVDLIIGNISDTLGQNPDSLAIIQNGNYRVLAQEKLGATGSISSRAKLATFNGTTWLYWFDLITDRVWRARDLNGNGVLDPIEFESAWDGRAFFGTADISCDSFSWDGTRALLPNDFNGIGMVELIDLNNDGLFDGPGEATLLFGTGGISAIGAGGQSYSIDDFETADYVGNNIYIGYEDDDGMVTAFDRTTGSFAPWLNLRNANFPRNVDAVAGLLPIPPVSGDLDRVAVDHTTTPPTVYLGVNFTSSAPYVYKAQDLNQDGDANDAGEVTLFVDGTVTAIPVVAIDDIDFAMGALYVSHEVAPSGANPGQFFEFIDLNNDGDANDPGEQFLIGSLPATNDPSVLSFSAVPAGFFGASCVDANISASAITSAGGTLSFTIDDIPLARQTGSEIALVALSVTPFGATPIAPGCTLGLGIDALTLFVLNTFPAEFTAGPILGNSVTTPGLVLPPGVVGSFEYAALFIGGSTFGATQTRRLSIL